MSEVSTLYKAALKVIVEDKLLVHPVDVKKIPTVIYEDVWKVTVFKNLQEVKREVIETIALLEEEYDKVCELYHKYNYIWDKTSAGLRMLHPHAENPPPPPPMMFHRIFLKKSDLDELLDVIDAYIGRKWEQVDAYCEEITQLQLHYEFNVKPSKLYVEVDGKFERRMSALKRRIRLNKIIIYHLEGE